MKHSDEQSAILDEYLRRILDINQSINLTSIDDWDSATMLMLEDSRAALPELERAPQGRYADLGTGGGFPGVPLGILTGRETWLVDSRTKKLDAIRSVLTTMGLHDQFVYYSDRIESLGFEHPKTFSVLTARALTSLPSLLELAAPLLRDGGELISFHATVDDELINRAEIVANIVGLALVNRRSFTLSDHETKRTLLTYRKVNEPSITLPRRIGVAQKKPLA